MTANIRRVERANASSPTYRADHAPIPGALDCRPFAGPDAPRDLMPDEVRVLVVLGEHASTIAAMADRLRCDSAALKVTVRRLEDRGLLTRFGPYGSALRLTTPTGRALARALADNPARSANTSKD